jgi:hypothetical protein
MPNFTDEESVCQVVARHLRDRRIPYEREVEVGAGGLRADFVTPDSVIEVKRVLGRAEIYQAVGQGQTYCRYLHRAKLIVIGQAPKQLTAYQQAQSIRAAVEAPGLQIIFIDRELWELKSSGFRLGLPARSRTRFQRRSHRRAVRSSWQIGSVLCLFGLLAVAWLYIQVSGSCSGEWADLPQCLLHQAWSSNSFYR